MTMDDKSKTGTLFILGWTALVLIFMLAGVVAADDTDSTPPAQSYSTVNSIAFNEESSQGNNPFWFGNISVVMNDTTYPGLFIVEDAYFPTGVYVELGINPSLWGGGGGGGLTSVWTDDPIDGDGTPGDPIDLSTSVAGNGLSMTANSIDVEVTPPIEIDGDTVGLDYSADNFRLLGTSLAYATDSVDDTHVDFGTGANQVSGTDIPVDTSNFDNVLGGGDDNVLKALETLDEIDVDDPQSLDDAYDDGHSVTVDSGAVIWTHPSGGTGTGWDSRTIRNHQNILQNNTSGNVGLSHYAEYSGAAAGTQWYELYTYSSDGGSTKQDEFGFQIGNGALHVGIETSGEVIIYDNNGNKLTISPVPDLGGDESFVLPANSAGYAKNDGSGNISYETPPNDYSISWNLDSVIALIDIITLSLGGEMPVSLSGTADYMAVWVETWTPVDASDTITITLYYDGVAKDTITSNAGSAGVVGGAIDEDISQGHYVEIYGQITSVNGGKDTIEIQSAIINVDGS